MRACTSVSHVRVSERQQYVYIKALARAWLEDHHGIGAPSAPLLLLSCSAAMPADPQSHYRSEE